jgi:nucleoside-diphosphate-sugar epimerase
VSTGGGTGAALVTGAAGFIGSQLTERLLATGTPVVGVDRLSDYYEPARKVENLALAATDPRFTFIEADLSEVATPALLDGIDVVYHLAGQPGVRPSWGQTFQIYLDDNVRATQALLEAAKEVSLSRFVYASSSSVYGNAERLPTLESDAPQPVSPYGVTKLAAEHLCTLYWHSFGVPTVSLRYFSVYGPRQRPDMAFHRFIGAALAGEPLTILGDGRQSRDFTYVQDVVSATLAAAATGMPGEVYNIAGGSRTTVLDVISILERLLETSLDVRHEDRARGDARDTAADTTKAKRDLDYSPRFDLEAGLEAQARLAQAPTSGYPVR